MPNCYLTASLSGGLTENLINKDERLRVNDAFYLHNFKGLKNLGYFYDRDAKKKGLGGDQLGFDKFLNLQVKLSQQDCPMLSELNIEPFVHANLALTPNRNPPQEGQTFL